MSTTTQTVHPGPAASTEPSDRRAPRARLISGRLALALLSSFGALTSFYLLLSVTPMYAVSVKRRRPRRGDRLLAGDRPGRVRLSQADEALWLRTVFAADTALSASSGLAGPAQRDAIVAVSIARGVGFGLNTVVIGALVATALPPERRGEGIGLAGVVACLPAIVALPSGVWLAENAGYPVVITITAVSALAPLAAIPWLTSRDHQAEAGPGPAQSAGLLASLRCGGQLRPSLVFAATTVSAGVVAAFLPLAAGVSGGVAASGCSCRPSPDGQPLVAGHTVTGTPRKPAGPGTADRRRGG
jgi:hypothetical protein